MAAIRLDLEEMKRVNLRIDELQKQLQTSIIGINDSLEQLNSNLGNGTEVGRCIGSYKTAVDTTRANLIDKLEMVKTYLNTKIVSYQSINTISEETLNSIQSSLSSINVDGV